MLVLSFALAGLCATDLAELPALPRVRAPIVAPTAEPQSLAPGIGMIRDQAVVLDGRRWVDKGPEEGLAFIATLGSGALHETLIRLTSDDAKSLKAAFIFAFGWNDGLCNDPLRRLPPRGQPVRVAWEWRDDDGAIRRIDASCLVRERTSDRPFPPLPFIYTGSRVGEVRVRERDGSERMVPSFKLAEHRTLIALFDEHDALLSTPLPSLTNDLHLEVNTGLAPPGGTSGRLILSPAVLPLFLWSDEQGGLRTTRDGAVLDDPAVMALLTQHYRSEDPTLLRAVGIHPAGDRPTDLVITARLLSCAVAARCWVVPVFVP